MTPQEALQIKREVRFRRFKDFIASGTGIGAGLLLAFGIFFGGIFAYDQISEFSYADYRREQNLLECLQEAEHPAVAFYCTTAFGPEKDDKERREDEKESRRTTEPGFYIDESLLEGLEFDEAEE